MFRKARRAMVTPRLEALENRSLLSVSVGLTGTQSGPWVPQPGSTPTSTVLVRFTTTETPAQIAKLLAPLDAQIETSYPDGPSVVALPPWESGAAASAALTGKSGVMYAEADASFHASGVQAATAQVIPNNPDWGQEWGMAAIDAPAAWGITTGTSSTLVAVLDTGIDLNNAAFAGRIWTNPSPGTDGYAGDVNGWNFIDGNANVQDQDGHGTHVSGIIAAAGNNGVGVAGIDWGATIMPVKVLDSQGNGTTDSAVSGIYYAVAHGAKVINASWGGDIFSQAELDALNYADSKGVVFVTAAGNDSTNNDKATTYPASYRTPNELVVAAVDETGALASYSNYGAKTVDIAAPGSDILSTIPGGFASYSGTSMATAFVTGTVALVSGVDPNLNAEQMVGLIKATVKPDYLLNGRMNTPGTVDVYAALKALGATAPVTASSLITGASSLETVEAGLLTNDGTYAVLGGNNTSYVNGIYQAVFGRAPSSSELSYQVNALNGGTTRLQFVQGMQNSTEGLRTRVGRWYINDMYSPQSLVTLKSDPGVAAWASRLASGSSDGSVLTALLSSPARYQGLGGTNAQFLSALYYEVLGRAPDASGLAFHLNEMSSGTSAAVEVQRFLSSPEGHLATVARLYENDLGSTYSIAALEPDNGVQHWAAFLGGD
jgi:thermitase